jgi:hypothetical protein
MTSRKVGQLNQYNGGKKKVWWLKKRFSRSMLNVRGVKDVRALTKKLLKKQD